MVEEKLNEIQEKIKTKKEKFKTSFDNFNELNELFGRKNIRNLTLEILAQDILTNINFINIVDESFQNEMLQYIKTVNNDFQASKNPLIIHTINLKYFNKIKTIIFSYLENIQKYFDNKFDNIQSIMNKQDVDIDDLNNDFKVLKETTLTKINVAKENFNKIENKYTDILDVINNKISI